MCVLVQSFRTSINNFSVLSEWTKQQPCPFWSYNRVLGLELQRSKFAYWFCFWWRWNLGQIPLCVFTCKISPQFLKAYNLVMLTTLTLLFYKRNLILNKFRLYRKVGKIVQWIPICPLPRLHKCLHLPWLHFF